MKTNKSLLAFLVIVSMFLSVIPSVKADFVSIQQVTPTTGIPGTTPLGGSIPPTHVSVTGQAEPHDLVRLSWDGHSITCTQLSCTVKTDVNGNYHLDFDVPLSVSGSHTISVTNLNVTSLLPVSQTFTVNSIIELPTASGHVGDSVTVLGTGFSANSAITATYDGDSRPCTASSGSSCQTDSNGSFTGTFTVPDSVLGRHDVRATDASNVQARAIFTVSRNVEITSVTNPSLPRADLHAGFPVVGSVIQGRVTGFIGVEDVTVFFTPDATGRVDGQLVGSFTTNGKGTLTFTNTIPPTPQLAHIAGQDFSTYFYRANDTGCPSVGCPTKSIRLYPLLTLNPDHAAFNQQVNGIGQGFSADGTVSVTLSVTPGCATSSFPALHTGPTDSNGGFRFSFIIQSSSRVGPGFCPVTATDQAGFFDTTRFILGTFLMTTPSTGIASDSTGNIQGTDIKVEGFVFSRNVAVDIKFDGNIVKTVTTDDNGDFVTDFPIPEAFGGTTSERISAVDHGTRCNGGTAACTASTSFTVVPWISMSPSSGTVGTQVTVWGSGFGSVLSLTAGTVDVRYCGASAGDGTLVKVPFAPDHAPLDQAIVCSDILVVPLNISPTAPSRILGTATRWTVYTTGSEISVGTASPVSSHPGSFRVTFTAPESWGGYHPVFANELNTERSSFNGALFRIMPTVSINPSSGQRNKIVTLRGTGFFQWEKYVTQTGDGPQQTFMRDAGVVIDFGPFARYVDQAHFIINGQVDMAWFQDLYRPIALNARGTIIYWDSLFIRLGSIGSQFLRIPSSEPDSMSITAYRFEMSTPNYSKDEAATTTFNLTNPEITQINAHTDDVLGKAVDSIKSTVNAARDMIMNVVNLIKSTADSIKASTDLIPGVRDTVNTVKSTTDNIKTSTDLIPGVKDTTNAVKTTTDTIKTTTDTIKSNTDQVPTVKTTTDSVKSTTDSIKSDTSNLTTSLPLVLQTPLGYIITILAAIAALGAVASALLVSRRLKVVK